MARPIVYGPAGSTYVWSVRLALAEKGVAHELVELDSFTAHREEPHLSRHPFAKVPAFEHDGFMLYETQAILRSTANPEIRVILTVAEYGYRIVARRSAGSRSTRPRPSCAMSTSVLRARRCSPKTCTNGRA